MEFAYAVKKVAKLVAISNWTSISTIINVNWNKLQATSQNAVTVLANTTTQVSDHINNITGSYNHTPGLAISNLGIPLAGSMAMGFVIGFMKS
jgi:hypothetical protein